MAQRTVRVNELLQREISDVLHTHRREEAVRITITGVDISPDLRQAFVFYSVVGEEEDRIAARKLLTGAGKFIRAEVARRVVLKYNPEYRFRHDDGAVRGAKLLNTLLTVEEEDKARDAQKSAE